MRFNPSALAALFSEPPADRLDIAIGAILEAQGRHDCTVSTADVRIAMLRLEELLSRL